MKACALFLVSALACSALGDVACVDVEPETLAAWRPLVDTWKRERERWYGGVIAPVGARPDGMSWTGFVSMAAEGPGGYALVFRELSEDAEHTFDLRPYFGLQTADPVLLAGRDTAICSLMSLNTVVEGCVIQDFKTVGLELRQADQTEIVGNVFENGPAAAQFSLSRDCRLIGNHYSDCRPYFLTGEGKSKTLVSPRVFNE